MELGVEQIKKGEISLKASEALNIPKAALHKRVDNKVESYGRYTATVLSTAFKFVLVSVLISLADWGFGRMFEGVIALVWVYWVSTNQSHLLPPNDIPGREWYQCFTKR